MRHGGFLWDLLVLRKITAEKVLEDLKRTRTLVQMSMTSIETTGEGSRIGSDWYEYEGRSGKGDKNDGLGSRSDLCAVMA